MNFVVMATGYKGLRFLQGLDLNPVFAVSYDNGEAGGLYHKLIEKHCANKGIKLYKKKNLKELAKEVHKVDKIFLIGWQYLLRRYHDKLVVFHDSYLPERRGFSPTVCALLSEEKYLGATALRPYENATQPDFGDVYCRMKTNIEYPITLKKSFEIVASMYVKMCNDILKSNIQPFKIDYSTSSFSLWRDKDDMRLDWSRPAKQILNKIFALGEPYDGALTVHDQQEIYIQEAELVEDLNFNNRAEHYGKIWGITDNQPVVVCGEGLLRIKKAINESGNIIKFKNMRRKFK